MIASLAGRITFVGDNHLVIELAGLGFKVHVPRGVLAEAQTGQTLSLHTYLVVRENELSLYGFPTPEAREMFTLLIGVERVGPKLGLAILSALSVANLRAAVLGGQSAVLGKVPGVGSKTAQKIVLHLADRILPLAGEANLPAAQPADGDLLDALLALGYSVVEAQAAIQSLPADGAADVEERLKLALRYFKKG
ncbi:MAG: Holliday junction branch migration protein RuvA [Anaerolineales bacterium]|nr:Holliday junction branch migration protein RuvA [Anaerolineales bacterium]MCW5839047.1 Holliday junction branch migration protein RuvA [Anaerolineales bacterium]